MSDAQTLAEIRARWADTTAMPLSEETWRGREDVAELLRIAERYRSVALRLSEAFGSYFCQCYESASGQRVHADESGKYTEPGHCEYCIGEGADEELCGMEAER